MAKGCRDLFDAIRQLRHCIDLAMRVIQRHANLAAPILKRHDIGDIRICHQLVAAYGQRVQQQHNPVRTNG